MCDPGRSNLKHLEREQANMNLKALTFTLLTIALLGATVQARPGRAPRTGGHSRQGTFSNGRGTGSYQGQSTSTRGGGALHQQYEGTRTGPRGKTQQVERTNDVHKTGDNSFHRDSSQSVTGANGQTRTRTESGDATVKKTENGYEKDYQGTITNGKGQTVDVNRQVDVTKNADGTVTKERSSEYSKPDGTPLRSGESTTTGTPGHGSATSGTWTNDVTGKTGSYASNTTRTGAGAHTTESTATGPNGNSGSAVTNSRWKFVDGKWIRTTDTTAQPQP